ncbi:MAG: enoyl-CoA hydratase/isomerase family protein [Janthinobacterium lividum]
MPGPWQRRTRSRAAWPTCSFRRKAWPGCGHSSHYDPAARQAAEEIATRSPFSLKATLRALRAAPGLGRLEPCLEQEYRLALACVCRPDFVEGVRAAVIDKDRSHRWPPPCLEDVAPDAVDAAFAAPAGLELDGWLTSRGISAWQ